MKRDLQIEIVYLERKKWPKNIIRMCHQVHLKQKRNNPKCPYCSKEWRWKP